MKKCIEARKPFTITPNKKHRIRVPSARYTTWLYLNRKRKPDNIDILIGTLKTP